MYSRVTEVELDLGRVSIDEALNRFRAAVLPALQEQPGYRGIYVMATSGGHALLVSLWATEQAATATDEGDWYFGVLNDFATFLRQPADRASYEVLVVDVPHDAPASSQRSRH